MRSPFRATLAIPEVSSPSFESLVRERFDPGLPCVMRALYPRTLLESWIARLAASEVRLPVVVLRRPDVAMISDAERPDAAHAAQHPDLNEFVAELSLAEIWRRISEPGALAPLVAAGETLYVFSAPVPGSLPFPPEGDAAAPIPALYRDPRGRQLLVSAPGLLNRCHAHIHSYLLHEIHGRKRVRLVSPAESHLVYPNADRRSSVGDFDRVDLSRFPRIAEATAWEAELAPGDVLFLPSYWWHEIRVDELAVSVGVHAPGGAARDTASELHEGIAEALARAAASGADPAQLSGIASVVFTALARDVARDGLDETVRGLRYSYE